MLDIRLIREGPDAVRANLARRRVPEKLEHLERVIAKDAEWRRDLQEMHELRHRRNAVSQEIGKAVKEGRDPATLKAEAAALPDRIKALEARVDALRAEVDDALLRLPNLLHDSVPDGAGPEDNVEVRRWGEPAAPSFPMKPHGALAPALGTAGFGA